jgi:hypothetical protein
MTNFELLFFLIIIFMFGIGVGTSIGWFVGFKSCSTMWKDFIDGNNLEFTSKESEDTNENSTNTI